MNKMTVILVAALCLGTAGLLKVSSQETKSLQTYEYATIRWDGRDNSHVVRPDGSVEKLAALFSSIPRPKNVDETAVYMTVAINTLAKEGYELAAATREEIIMKRRPTP